MKPHPTFEQLREHKELSVIYPDTGKCFRVSLRSWADCLWAIRVYPYQRHPSDAVNPFVTAHRLMPRAMIEQWLESLRLLRLGQEAKAVCPHTASTLARLPTPRQGTRPAMKPALPL
jgi:hypothetical protein